MSNPYRNSTLEIPESLARQLASYRRRIWRQKMSEAVLLAAAVLGGASLLVLAVDRFVDSPTSLRAGFLVIVAASVAAIPWYFYRWVYKRRRPVQLARLMSRRMPRIGDSLLGVLELAGDAKEQARSESLCTAAIKQVAEQAQRCDFNEALPPSRLRLAAAAGAGVATLVLIFAVWFPAATANAWSRLLLPWRDTPRYTLAAIEPLPENLVVPHGEPFTISATLAETTRWRPNAATARLGRQPWVMAPRDADVYQFALHPLREPADLTLKIGDARPTIHVIPKLRPELNDVLAKVWLPDYLERADPLELDISAGRFAALAGSRVQLLATADRPLDAARFQAQSIPVEAAALTTPEVVVESDQTLTLQWQDSHGLSGAAPFVAALTVIEDRRPAIAAEQLPTDPILLTTTSLPFQVEATDDYGVRRVGYQWRSVLSDASESDVANGERLLAVGGPAVQRLVADAVFSATQLGLNPGPVELRLFVEDYRPDGKRVYSKAYRFEVLTPEQHAAWLGRRLNRWQTRALEIRDRELQLHEANQALRALPPESLNQPETRRQLEEQAAAEKTGARRLSRLSDEGAELARLAIDNPSIDAAQLERWAAMLKTLEQIADQRMPSVADLLKQSAASREDDAPTQRSPSAPLVEAVDQQEALLAEFQAVAAEIGELLANLEGSTLVKRLKAEARRQNVTADRINEQLESTFGRERATQNQPVREALTQLAARQRDVSERVAQIVDDMQAYQTRRSMPRFQSVLKEMQTTDVVGRLLEIAQQVDDNQGLSLAAAEYWADALDQWAEQLIDPSSTSNSPGGKSGQSLPPPIVLETLRILQAEVDLRVATRVAEQARPAVEPLVYRRDAAALARRQTAIAQRVQQLAKTIARNPNGQRAFRRELDLLAEVHRTMTDAAEILARPDTGVAAIAAETEAIERLLASRQLNPRGGEPGEAPGGSTGQGEADAALASIWGGNVRAPLERPSDVVQATGAVSSSLPAEYRAGLDRYFNLLEAAIDTLPR